jgi:predicted amidohydrolase
MKLKEMNSTSVRIGVAQIANSSEVNKNFEAIMSGLESFRASEAHIVLFPECALSGFTSKMKSCTELLLSSYFQQIQSWVKRNEIEVVLPTAVTIQDQVFNSGRWFKKESMQEFYKIGLTPSEEKFFSRPDTPTTKVFESHGFRFAVLICHEAQQEAEKYFVSSDVDCVLWPAYWGSTLDDVWALHDKNHKINLIYQNNEIWKKPILQANFSGNDLDGHHGAGPEGLSYVVGADNALLARGPHKLSGGILVELGRDGQVSRVVESLKF